MTDIYSTSGSPIARESTIEAFFRGDLEASALDREWRHAFDVSREHAGSGGSRHLSTVKLVEEVALHSTHCVRLVDAVMHGELSLEALDAVCFVLESSDGFAWDGDTDDGERVAFALFWLGTPEVNYPFSDRVLRKVRHYLVTGDNQLTSEDLTA